MSERVESIHQILTKSFEPVHLYIDDQSALHAGHAGAKGGLGHFAVLIVSDKFNGKSLLERHRMIYSALGTMMQTDIHALSIKSLTQDEYQP